MRNSRHSSQSTSLLMPPSRKCGADLRLSIRSVTLTQKDKTTRCILWHLPNAVGSVFTKADICNKQVLEVWLMSVPALLTWWQKWSLGERRDGRTAPLCWWNAAARQLARSDPCVSICREISLQSDLRTQLYTPNVPPRWSLLDWQKRPNAALLSDGKKSCVQMGETLNSAGMLSFKR